MKSTCMIGRELVLDNGDVPFLSTLSYISSLDPIGRIAKRREKWQL